MKKMRISMLAVAVAALLGLPAMAQELETQMAVCNACHGQNGQPIAPNIPIIWGQQTAFLVKQIHDYKSKDRDNPIMTPLTEQIKQPDIRKVATYFSAKTWPAKNPAVDRAAGAGRPHRLPHLPSAEFRGRPAGAAPRRAELRLSALRLEQLRRRDARQQRRHGQADAGDDAGAAGDHRALSLLAVSARLAERKPVTEAQ